ncbi:hypothetical protein BHE74_00054380 [Ensete ventricosum]|nr:hypothetical protein BHE74_00054380 [Ensete ventricosum]RZR75738.1 hypothetical protein BHM03_00000218 [Ensete ventricosum]
MAFSASRRFQSPASSVHLRSFLGLTCRTTASIPLAPSTKRRSTIRMVSRFPNGKYIREDYLVVPISLRLTCCFFQPLFALAVLTVLWGAEEGVGQGGAGADEGGEDCPSRRGLLRNLLAVEYEGNALFVKVDTDDEYEFARDMQVRGLPTLYFISPDRNKDAIRTEGLVPPEMIKNIIDNEISCVLLKVTISYVPSPPSFCTGYSELESVLSVVTIYIGT